MKPKLLTYGRIVATAICGTIQFMLILGGVIY